MAALVVGFLKAAVGAGIGLALTPVLTLVLPAPAALGLIAPLMNLSDPMTLRLYWGRWDARQLRLLVPTALAGTVLGTWAVASLSEAALRQCIAVVALLFAIAQAVASWRGRPLLGRRPHWSVGVAAGGVTGVASTVAHSGGLVAGIYLLGLGLPAAGVVATATALYAWTNLFKTVGYWQIGFLTPRILGAAVLATPLLFAGVWIGYRTNGVLPRRWFEAILIAIAVAGSLKLLAS